MLFDAPSDTSDAYFGVPYEASTPFRRAIEEGLIDPKKTLQVGLHGTTYTAKEHEYALAQGIEIITSENILEYGIKWVVQHYNKLGDGPIYVSIDMDVLDPAYAPASLPSPRGISSRELIYLLHKLGGRRIVGADVAEVQSPHDSRSKMTCCWAAQLIFDLVCLAAMGKGE